MVLVVHLHLGFAEAMLDAGSLDAGLKARADLLGELRRDLLAQETGDMLGLHRQHRLAGKVFIQGLEGLGGAKDKIEGVLHLHQAPVVALVEGLQDRAAQLSVTVERLMQLLGLERIRKRLCPPPVIDPHKGIVGKGKADAGASESPRQPAVSVAIELQPEGTPCRHAQVTQPDLAIDEVKVVVEALAGVGLKGGLAARFVVPGPVAVASFHRRDDVHQSRMIAAPLEHLGHDILLADVRLADVLDRDSCRRRQLLRTCPERIAQRFGKTRVVEYPNPLRLQKCRHPLRVARLRQRACHHNPVVAGEHPVQPVPIALNQIPPHLRPPSPTLDRAERTSSSMVPAQPA